jgi:hypothetical protein
MKVPGRQATIEGGEIMAHDADVGIAVLSPTSTQKELERHSAADPPAERAEANMSTIRDTGSGSHGPKCDADTSPRYSLLAILHAMS